MTAALPIFPFPDHRTQAEVMADEALQALPGPRQWCAGCQRNVTFETATTCRLLMCPKRERD